MSFEFEISEKDLAAADFMSDVNRALISAFNKKLKEHGITRKQIADLLEVDKSQVSRALRGDANLTTRSIGELLWALDLHGRLELTELLSSGTNAPRTLGKASSASWHAQAPISYGTNVRDPSPVRFGSRGTPNNSMVTLPPRSESAERPR